MELITRWTFIIGILGLFNLRVQAQTADELFNQKQTQLRYLVEQIAALKAYTGYLNQGYEIVSDGAQAVRNLKSGEFTLHDTFFKSLKAVNPLIRSSGRVADIISSQLAISKSLNQLKGLYGLSLSQQNYIALVKSQVLREANNDLEELLLIISPGRLEMGDDERMKRVDKIHGAMLDKRSFTQSFCNELSMLVYQKEHEKQSINHVRNLYEND
jgi:hypothetical protein